MTGTRLGPNALIFSCDIPIKTKLITALLKTNVTKLSIDTKRKLVTIITCKMHSA